MILEREKLIKAAFSKNNFESASVISFKQSDFIQPESEETSLIVRLSDLSIASEDFYAFSLVQSGILKEKIAEFIEGTEFLFSTIFADEAMMMVKEKLESLNSFPDSLLPAGNIIEAVKMIDDWYYVSVFIKTDQEYYSFFWETSA